MSAAGIVTNHSAERASAVRRGVGAKRQMVKFGPFPQPVQHHARLDTRESCLGVDLQNPIHVFREIEDHRDIATLPGQARARAARQNRSAELFACHYCRDHIAFVPRNHQANGNLPVIRGIRGIKRAAAAVEADFSLYRFLQFLFQFSRCGERVHRLRVRTER